MGFAAIFLTAVGLAMDAFAVSVAAAASGQAEGRRAAFRLSFHFGLFQFLMPVLGWFTGIGIAGFLEAIDHWIAFALLAIVGGRMIRSGLNPDEAPAGDPSRGWMLVSLSIATSIDAYAVGLGLAMLQVGIWVPGIIIGVVASSFSLLGIALGKRLGKVFGHRMEIAGGVILILIGLRILWVHLAS